MASRSSTFCSTPASKKCRPEIQHPLFRFSVDKKLAVTGQQSRSATCVVNGVQESCRAASARDNDSNNNTSSGYILNWPPEFMKDVSPGKKPKKKEKAGKKVLGYQDELDFQIQEKLSSGFYGVRHLFKANDSYGHGVVSREALRHILFAMVGYIEGFQFIRFLKRHGLDNKMSVSFDNFVACFQGGENGKKEWMSPCQRAAVEKKVYPEEHLRNTEFWMRDTTHQSGTYCFSLFKKKAKEKDFELGRLLPAACFKRDGKVIPPQLREAMAQLGLRMTNEEFHKVWDRFDWEGIGAIKTKHLLKILALGSDGKPEGKTQSASKPAREKPVKADPGKLEVTNSAIWRMREEAKIAEEKKSAVEQDVVELERKKSEIQLKQVKRSHSAQLQPRMDNIMDSLHFRFEEPFNLLLAAFQLFDLEKKGYVSKIDFRRVLLEFGFNLPLRELDVFLMRCGVRPKGSEVNYTDVLNKFQSKGESSLTHRIITSNRFQDRTTEDCCWSQLLTAEDLELQLVLFFHGEFMRFVKMLKKYDPLEVNVVTQTELCDILEKFLGQLLTEKQFSRLIRDLGLEKEGLVPYHRLLHAFTTNPKEWHKKLDWGRTTLQTNPSQLSLVSEGEHVDFKGTGRSEPDIKPQKEMGTAREVEFRVGELLKRRFHTFDKNYKHMDRRKMGKLNRFQFRDLLKTCGLELETEEVLLVWACMGVRHDGVIGYLQLLAHFLKQTPEAVRYQYTKPEELKDHRRMVKKAKAFIQERMKNKLQKQDVEVQEEKRNVVESKVTYDRAMVDEALDKIHDQVITNWDTLKRKIRQLDPNGFASIAIAEMKVLLTSLTNLTPEEIAGVLHRYDTRNGRFSYMDFMNYYKHHGVRDATRSSTDNSTRPQTAPVGTFREPVHKCLQLFQKQVLSKWKNVRHAFKVLDVNNDGYVVPCELRRVLTELGIGATEANLYHLMSEFDTNMDGRISYKEFLEQCLPL